LLHVGGGFRACFFIILVGGVKERMHLFFVDWKVNGQGAFLWEESPRLLLCLYHFSKFPNHISFVLGAGMQARPQDRSGNLVRISGIDLREVV
jgi:hypothetical protein